MYYIRFPVGAALYKNFF